MRRKSAPFGRWPSPGAAFVDSTKRRAAGASSSTSAAARRLSPAKRTRRSRFIMSTAVRDLAAAKTFALRGLEAAAYPAPTTWTRAVHHRLARLDRKILRVEGLKFEV